jgi:peptide/nickel transport system permease protein
MFGYVLQRLAAGLPVLVLTSIIVFSIMRLLPGDPIMMMVNEAGSEISTEALQHARERSGLDRPVIEQYFLWVQHAASGDLGRSILNGQPIAGVLFSRMLPTFQIGFLAWLFSIFVAVPLGIASALRPRSTTDRVATGLTLGGAALPYFLFGGVLIFALSIQWKLLPSSGYVSPFENFGASIRTTILPATTLSAGIIAAMLSQCRSSFSDILNADFIKTARMKGLTEMQVIRRHAFRNAMLPVVTIMGIQLGTVFSGAVVTETIFAVPGIGRLLVDSVLSRDYPVVSAVVLFISIAVVLSNLAVDIIYGLVDPRVRTAMRAPQ